MDNRDNKIEEIIENVDQLTENVEKLDSPFKNTKEINNTDDLTGVQSVTPSIPAKLLTDFIKYIEKNERIPTVTSDAYLTYRLLAESSNMIKLSGEKLENGIKDLNWFNKNTYNNEDQDPSFRTVKSKKGSKITGDAVLSLLSAKAAKAGPLKVPLWHSGFWVTIKPLTIVDFENIYTSIVNTKAVVGKKTNGYLSSNMDFIVDNVLLDYFLNNIIATSIDIDNDKLGDYIDEKDIPLIHAAIVAELYPKGYEVAFTCGNVIDENNNIICNNNIKAKINILKCFRKNDDIIDGGFRQFMFTHNSPKNKATVKEIEEYQKALREKIKYKSITFNLIEDDDESAITINFKNATILEKLDSGFLWLELVNKQIENALDPEDNSKAKENSIRRLTNITKLHIFLHNIESIEIDGSIVSNTNDISNALNLISSYKTAADELFKALIRYNEENTFAMIAVPNFKCPSCRKKLIQVNVKDGFDTLIPLNTINTVFTLVEQKVNS